MIRNTANFNKLPVFHILDNYMHTAQHTATRVTVNVIYGLEKLLFDTLFHFHNTLAIIRFFKPYTNVFP